MSNIGPRETFLGLQSRAIYWERDGLDPSVRPPARGGRSAIRTSVLLRCGYDVPRPARLNYSPIALTDMPGRRPPSLRSSPLHLGRDSRKAD